MTKQERSYFKKFALAFSDEESSNYIKLFDEIQIQSASGDEYDESKIKGKEFKGKFLKNFSYHKNYLYRMILNSLMIYNKENYDIIILRNLITKFELLFDKNLYSQCRKVLLKAKEIAEKKENYSILYELLIKEKHLNKFTLTISEFSAENKIITKKLDQAVNLMQNTIEYINLNDQFMIKAYSIGSAFCRHEKELEEINKFFENEFLKDDTKAITFRSKNLLFGLKAHHALMKKDFECMYKYNKLLIELWEKKLDNFKERIENYFIAQINLMNSQIRLRRFKEFDQTTEKVKNLDKKFAKNMTERRKTFLFYSISVLTLSKYFAAHEFGKLERNTEEVENSMAVYEYKITLQQRIILYYFLGLYNFVFTKYEKCIYWMEKIISSEKSDFSENYQCFARILHLLSYFELEYYDSLEYSLKSTYHFLKKKDRVFKYENIVLKYLRKSFRLKTSAELIEMLKEMKDEINNIAEDDFEQNALDIFDISQWIDSKIQNKSLIEILVKQISK